MTMLSARTAKHRFLSWMHFAMRFEARNDTTHANVMRHSEDEGEDEDEDEDEREEIWHIRECRSSCGSS